MNAAIDGSRHAMERQLSPTTETLHEARLAVGSWASQHPEFESRLADIALVVSELASNAIEASDGTPYEVSGQIRGRVLQVSVANNAVGATPPPSDQWGPDDVLAARGRGLAIVQGVADDVTVSNDGAVVRVTATFLAPS